jgi:glycosyltransferase domain-containing protein
MAPLLTVVIPTYNRADVFTGTLGLLQNSFASVPIIVADGSDDEHAEKNAECKRLGQNISYFHLPTGSEEPIKNYFRRVNSALDQVATPYVVFCGDDDIIVSDNVQISAQFLEDNKDYVACHGSYLLFRYNHDAIQIENIVYEGASIDSEEVGGRLMQLFSSYEASYYAVFRTSVQRKLLTRCEQAELPLWPETYHSTAAVIEGKIKRLDNIHCLRNIGNTPHHSQQIRNFGRWVASDLDGFLERYRTFRQSAVGWATEQTDGRIGSNNLQRAFDMAFVLYLGREFDPSYWIEQYLAIAISDETEKGSVRARLEQILYEGDKIKIEKEKEEEKLVVFPLHEATVSLLISVLKSIVGEKRFRQLQAVRRLGLKGMRDAQRELNRGWLWKDDGWTLKKAANAEQQPEIRVAGFLKRRYPQEQWDLLRKFPLKA